MLVVDEMIEGITASGGVGDHVWRCWDELVDDAFRSWVDEPLAAVALEREEAVVNMPLIPSGGNDDELVLHIAVEHDNATIIVSVGVGVGENASR